MRRNICVGILFLTLTFACAGCSEKNTSEDSSVSSEELETPPSSDTMLGVPLSMNGETFTTLNDIVEVTRDESLYSTNSTAGAVVASLTSGTQLQRIALGSVYSAVVYNNQICYINSGYVKTRPDATLETLSVSDLHITLEDFQQIAAHSNTAESETSNTEISNTEIPNAETEVGDTSAEPSSDHSISVERPAAGSVGAVMPDLASLSILDNTAIPWGYNKTDRNERNQPNGCIYFDRLYGDYNADFYRKDSDYIYLTMDEGYENGLTPQILDTLAAKNVKAVFFITYDFAVKNPDLVRRMIDEGHIVGNHSYTHPSSGIPSLEDINAQYNEFMINHNYVLENFGYEMYLFRFPEGNFSVRSLALAQSLGYRSVFWSYAYHDWDTSNQPDVATSLQQAVSEVHPGAIYLLHACSQTNATMLGDFIDQVRAAGYEFSSY